MLRPGNVESFLTIGATPPHAPLDIAILADIDLGSRLNARSGSWRGWLAGSWIRLNGAGPALTGLGSQDDQQKRRNEDCVSVTIARC